MNALLMSAMADRLRSHQTKVIFENYTVTHTDGITYTRVRGKCKYVWIPLQLLPKDPELDKEYFIDSEEFHFWERVRR